MVIYAIDVLQQPTSFSTHRKKVAAGVKAGNRRRPMLLLVLGRTNSREKLLRPRARTHARTHTHTYLQSFPHSHTHSANAANILLSYMTHICHNITRNQYPCQIWRAVSMLIQDHPCLQIMTTFANRLPPPFSFMISFFSRNHRYNTCLLFYLTTYYFSLYWPIIVMIDSCVYRAYSSIRISQSHFICSH